MRAWVFSEDMIEPALERMAVDLGPLFPGDVELAKTLVRRFLISDAAIKLRVAQCEPVEAAPVVALQEQTGVLAFTGTGLQAP